MNSAIPSEGPIRTSWPALRNPCCANLGDSRPRRQRIRSLRDNWPYRAANTCAQAGPSGPFPGLRRAEKPSPEKGCPSAGPAGASGPAHLPCPQPRRRRQRSMDWYPFEWYPYLSIGMDWYPMHWSPFHSNAIHPRPRRRPDTRRGKRTTESRGGFTTIPVRPQNTRR